MPGAVQFVELSGYRVRFRLAVREQKAERDRRVGQPAGGVQSRSQAEGDSSRIDRSRAARHLRQGPQTGPGADGDQFEALSHIVPILASQSGEVRDGADRHQVQQFVQRRRQVVYGSRSSAHMKSVHDLESETDAAQVAVRIGPHGRMDEMAVWEDRTRLMMVDDHHLQAQVPGQGHLIRVVDAAVDGHEHRRLAGGDGLHRGPREPVPFFEAAGEVPLGFQAQAAQSQDHESGGRHPVGIVVAVDHDAAAPVDGLRYHLHRLVHVPE